MQTLTMQHQPWAVSSWLSWWQWLLIGLNVMDQNVMDLTALRSCLSSSRNPTTSLNMLSTRLVLSWTWWLWRVGCRRLASQILLVRSTKRCWPFLKGQASVLYGCTIISRLSQPDTGSLSRPQTAHSVGVLLFTAAALAPWHIYQPQSYSLSPVKVPVTAESHAVCAQHWVRPVQPVQPKADAYYLISFTGTVLSLLQLVK